MDENLAILRTKKISLFMRQAREKSAQTVDNCAFWLNINREEYLTMESGTVSPSLPQLESLAYFLNSSFGFLLNGPDKEEEIKSSFSQDVNINFLNLRNHIIAVLLKQHRLEKNITLEQFSQMTSIPVDVLEAYEDGTFPVPVVALENLIDALDVPLDKFFSIAGPLGHPSAANNTASSPLEDLPDEMREFISKPVNRPYLDLALRLSKMEADKLRSIAASLLEITY